MCFNRRGTSPRMDYRINQLYITGNQNDIMVITIDPISNHRRILIVVDYMVGVLIYSILILSPSMYYMILYLITWFYTWSLSILILSTGDKLWFLGKFFFCWGTQLKVSIGPTWKNYSQLPVWSLSPRHQSFGTRLWNALPWPGIKDATGYALSRYG
jgi:hypothetical protein